MTLADLISTLETIAPLHAAEAWDNVGLLLGSVQGAAETVLDGPVLLTIDFTESVAQEAIDKGARCVVSYHPPIFKPIDRLGGATARSRALLTAARAGVVIYSPHTALDAAPGGVTDWLCDMLALDGSIRAANAHETVSLGDRRALSHSLEPGSDALHKIVTFAPPSAVDRLRHALASIGAGRIGDYSLCSFGARGAGTFRGSKETAPAVGEPGKFETVEEVRLEMVCPAPALSLAVEMIQQFHPYEEPPIDIYPLAGRPTRSAGAGRRITLDQPATVNELAQRLKRNLAVPVVKITRAHDTPIERVGVCPGSGASLASAAIAEGCTCFVTGEMQHHDALAAVEQGCSIILAGHTNTERGYLPTYAAKINELAPEAQAVVSESDTTLFDAA